MFGRESLADTFGDMVFYRNFEPLDRRLPKLKVALRQSDLSSDRKPRKQDADYARIALYYAGEAQQLRRAGVDLSELVFIGDTLYNDGGAYVHMLEASGWQGSCFIGNEMPDEAPAVEVKPEGIYLANRWSKLGDWADWMLNERGLHLDSRTLVVVDIDKTAIGAKGRNDKVIDRARIDGAHRTMSNLLGARFDGQEFEKYYNEFNQTHYHKLTADNQDYLAYVCLVVSVGLMEFKDVVKQVQSGAIENFDQFTRLVEMRMQISPVGSELFRQAHDAVVFGMRNGDPTPFKRLRRQEFISTVDYMGKLEDDASADDLLADEITLTAEVIALSKWLKERGCLLLCLSDKPDEASCPHPHVSPDLPPVHRAETHLVGTDIQPQLGELDE